LKVTDKDDNTITIKTAKTDDSKSTSNNADPKIEHKSKLTTYKVSKG